MLTPQIISTIRAASTASFVTRGKSRSTLKALFMLPLMFLCPRLSASAHDAMSAPGGSDAAGPAAQSSYMLGNSAQGLGQGIVNSASGALQSVQNAPAAPLGAVPPPPTTLPGAADAAGSMAFSWASYLQGMGLFFILLALLWLAVWLLKRYGAGGFKALTGREKNLELVETLSLGPKRAAILLRAKDRTFLLGVTEHKISMLSEMYDDTGSETRNFQPDQTQR